MKPVLNELNQIHYVHSSLMIKFIRENSNMEHNKVSDFVRDYDICDGEFGPAYWDKKDLILLSDEYNKEQVEWVGAFFEAHPWIERMMIVFND
jgi:hypothetical protein